MSRNVEFAVKGEKLTITIDISAKAITAAPMSSTGKTKVVATTSGNLPIGVHGLTLGLNLYTKE